MAKKSKKAKRTGIEIENPTIGGSIKAHAVEILAETAEGALEGATAGGVSHLVFGTPAGLSIGLGAGGGSVFGFGRGTLKAHALERRIHSATAKVIDLVDDAVAEAETEIAKSGTADVAEALNELRLSLVGEAPEEEEEKPAKAKKEKEKKGSRRSARA